MTRLRTVALSWTETARYRVTVNVPDTFDPDAPGVADVLAGLDGAGFVGVERGDIAVELVALFDPSAVMFVLDTPPTAAPGADVPAWAAYVGLSEVAAERGTHYVEEAVRVYLMRDLNGADRWVIDPTTFGDPLFSEYSDYGDSGPVNDECRCERPDECAAVVERMSRVGMPDGEELMRMLAAARGYTVTRTATGAGR
ncbi:hypothetical protein ACFYVR_26300 [Rhodococcus sp. NPDC003318]|uniref:hypothetical protein n=1 Tax=Rhodococcus sp. NPDC003318 TaxID=3364503 RepID=UPI0036907D1A